MQKARYVAALGIPLLALLSFTLATAWTGPTAAPPGNNVEAPINVGSIDQVKNGGLGVNALAVFGNSLFGGASGANVYLNFGATSGTSGYGIRDNAGTLEFKNSGGSWSSLQNTIFTLCGEGACGGGGGGGGSASLTTTTRTSSNSGQFCNVACPAVYSTTGCSALCNGSSAGGSYFDGTSCQGSCQYSGYCQIQAFCAKVSN